MTVSTPPRPFTVYTVPSRTIATPLPAALDQQLVTLAHDAVRNAGLTRGDSRGEDWTQTLTTIGVGQKLNQTQSNLMYDPGTSPAGLGFN